MGSALQLLTCSPLNKATEDRWQVAGDSQSCERITNQTTKRAEGGRRGGGLERWSLPLSRPLHVITSSAPTTTTTTATLLNSLRHGEGVGGGGEVALPRTAPGSTGDES
jgi:hypothetical protein